MPNISQTSLSNGDLVSEFVDSVGTVGNNYTLPAEYDNLQVRNNGTDQIQVSLNGLDQKILSGDTWNITTKFTTFQVKSLKNVQSFEVKATKGSMQVNITAAILESSNKNQASIQEITNTLNIEPPRIVTLIGGQEDETTTTSNCTVSADKANFKIGNQAWKIAVASAVTAWMRVNFSTPVVFPAASAVGVWFYIDTPANVTQIEFNIQHPSGSTWTRSIPTASLATGWNFVRWPASDGITQSALQKDWGKGASYCRTVIYATAAVNVTVAHMWVECPKKAAIVFIEDSGYKSFYDKGYPDLLKRGIPVTWAIDPAILGSNAGTNSERISIYEVKKAANENKNIIGFHGYDGAATASMTTAQIKADNMNAIKWLEQQGYFNGRTWRAAWVQNSATNHAAAQSLLLAYATPSGVSALTSFPPPDRWNIPRIALHSQTTSALDTYFANLRATNQLMVLYTHGIDSTAGIHTTPDLWKYFLKKVDSAMNEGWLEMVTYEQLLARAGVRYRRGNGDWVTEIYNSAGGLMTQRSI